jgi:pimeloyl-ACP methyl ester carboxylesterase
VVRGANSDLLTAETVARMRERRPDLIAAEVPDRGHVPFLDEPEALAALEVLIARTGL